MGNRLGTKLRNLRRHRSVSLRAVEAATGISNAYLSQLERGLATRPTPAKLKALAQYFDVPYLDLLASAGYLPGPVTDDAQRLVAAPDHRVADSPLPDTLSDLTDDEEAMVLQYIEFLKSRRSSTDRA